MKLSPIYDRVMYGVVYETGHHPNQPEVEFVEDFFFYTTKEARDWFKKNYIWTDFMNPRVVMVTGFDKLVVKDSPLRKKSKKKE